MLHKLILALLGYTGDLIVDGREHKLLVGLSTDDSISDQCTFNLASYISFIEPSERFGIVRPDDGPLKLKNATGETPVLDNGSLSEINSGQIKIVGEIQRFTSSGVELVDGKLEEFDSVILATGYTNNVSSWLKEESLSGQGQGNDTKTSWLSNMKGKNGMYIKSFIGEGLIGASIDAERAGEDIARQWNSYRKHPNSKINPYM